MDVEMEIDPELFMICRLCVDSKGKFQILPAVQKNIKDFFDIDVQPFDGLSQLICNSCKIILSEFSNVKNTYQLKQKSLLERAKKGPQNEQNSDSSENKTETLQTEASPVPSPAVKDDEKRMDTSDEKRADHSDVSPDVSKEYDRRHSSSTTGVVSDTEHTETVTSTQKKSLRLCRLTETHTRLFNCRLCTKQCKNVYSLKKHMKTHRELICQHAKILSYNCYVPLHRLEGPTGKQDDTVKLDLSLIIGEGANPDYFVTYKNRFLAPESPVSPMNRRKRSSYAEYFHESDEEKHKNRSNKKFKRMQVLSDSEESNATVTNDQQNEIINLDTQDMDTDVNVEDLGESMGLHDPCNILVERVTAVAEDDTTYISDNSSNDTTAAIKDKEQRIKNKEKDLKLIEEVIQAAYRRYESNESDKLTSTKKNDIRKFLSIGRRVLTPNFRATGLIKYLEKNDLKINWIDQNKGSTVAQNQSKSEAHFIRIGSKMEEFPSGDNLYGFTRHEPLTEVDAPTDAEKALLLSYYEVQKGISKTNNDFTKGSNDTYILHDHNSLQMPTAQHLLTILNRSQMPFPKKTNDNQPVINVSPLNKPTKLVTKAPGNVSLTNNRPITVNKSLAAAPPPAKVPQPMDMSDDDDDGIGQPTFVMVNPASVKIKPVSKKSNYVMNNNATSTITNSTVGAGKPNGSLILNKNPVLNPKPAGVTYKNKGRSESVSKAATLVPIGTPVFQQPPVRKSSANQSSAVPLNTDQTSVSIQNPSLVNALNNPPIQVAPTAKPSDESPSSLADLYLPAPSGDAVICLDDEESLDRMPVITSTTSLATVKGEPRIETTMKTINNPLEAEQTKNQSETESQQPMAKNAFPHRTYIKCKPVHELMRSSLTPDKDNEAPNPVTSASPAVTENGSSDNFKPTKFLSIDGTVDRLTIPAPNNTSSTNQNENASEQAKHGKVLLNTVMLPNLMTNSPFNYLKELMTLQGLTLIEKPDSNLVCLIKFKLGVHQPPVSTMLCLYLMARPQVFCVKITNGDIVSDVKAMSAAWQMEILKAFLDKSVSGKILQGAESKGTDLLASVKLFFSILNSIEMKNANAK